MKIGILGMGTIGSGVYELAGKIKGLEVKKVLEKRFEAPYTTTDIEDIASDPEIKLVVETMGGLHPAYEYAVRMIESGKHYVTANKLLVSAYGQQFTALARSKGKAFLYSAACGGGIPFLRNLQLAREGDCIEEAGGILNGTTNFILDCMQSKGMDYHAALAEAQERGYAERDSSSDTDGLDTMRKLVLVCSVGFGRIVEPSKIPVFGITAISSIDIEQARSMGRCIRLCCTVKAKDGSLCAYVEPRFCLKDSPESSIRSNVNYAWYRGKSCGVIGFTGQGAGRYPTASNIIRDILSVNSSECLYMTDESSSSAEPDCTAESHRYYVRISKEASFPESLISRRNESGTFSLIETIVIPLKTIHSLLDGIAGAFAAGIEENA